MDILHEVPGVFRITLIRTYAFRRGGPTVNRATPFVLNFRAPSRDAVEHVELPDELFQLFLTLPTSAAVTVSKFIEPEYRLSAGMLEQLQKSPRELLAHVVAPTPRSQTLGAASPTHIAPTSRTRTRPGATGVQGDDEHPRRRLVSWA